MIILFKLELNLIGICLILNSFSCFFLLLEFFQPYYYFFIIKHFFFSFLHILYHHSYLLRSNLTDYHLLNFFSNSLDEQYSTIL